MAGEEDRHNLFSYLEGRFGISKGLFDDCLLFKKNKTWWLLKDSPLVKPTSQLKVRRIGLKAFQSIGIFIKPTTRMIQLFGHKAARAVLDINERDIQKLAAGGLIPAVMDIDNGYVILSFKSRILGLGLLIDGMVRSQIPQKDIKSFI